MSIKNRSSLQENLRVVYVPPSSLRHPEKNPRVWSKEARQQLRESIERHGVVDPLVVNSAPKRNGIIVGGNFRFEVLKEMGYKTVPIVHVNIPDAKKEAELIIRLNKNTGDWDLGLLAEYDESLLSGIGFSSEELDNIFPVEEHPEIFDLQKELQKLNIKNIDIKHGDIFEWPDGSRVMNGDSTVEADMLKLMDGEKADLRLSRSPVPSGLFKRQEEAWQNDRRVRPQAQPAISRHRRPASRLHGKMDGERRACGQARLLHLDLREPEESPYHLERARETLAVSQHHYLARAEPRLGL